MLRRKMKITHKLNIPLNATVIAHILNFQNPKSQYYAPVISPGEFLGTWRICRTSSYDLSVFVQLGGPSSTVHGVNRQLHMFMECIWTCQQREHSKIETRPIFAMFLKILFHGSFRQAICVVLEPCKHAQVVNA